MALFILTTLSTEYLRVTVSAAADPTGDTVEFAFVGVSAYPGSDIVPQESDWVTGEWETGGPPYVARLLVGPNDQVVPPGEYRVWLRITDNPEIPVLEVGDLIVSDEAQPDDALATIEDLAAAGVDVSDTARAEFALRSASATVRSYTHQWLSYVADDEIVIRTFRRAEDCRVSILLPEVPALSVSAVTVDDAALTAEDWDLYNSGAGILRLDTSAWWQSKFVITYTHGYLPVPADVVAVVVGLAGRIMTGGLSGQGVLQSETITNYSYTLATPASASALTADETRALARYVLHSTA